ncbi:MAG TPA: DUF2935 domain-containing protein [Clostridiales bacterium]|nr:DUF2935 domain-containing protein [Clostridiales bacterium]
MLSRDEFIRISLETNLFFQRIMKEHMFFIETSLQPVEAANIAEADVLKRSFEQLMAETIPYANGVVSKGAVESNEFVTPYTLRAENVTSKLTGASINTSITKAEEQLVGNGNIDNPEWLEKAVREINARSLNMLGEVIEFKKKLIGLSLECKIFIAAYDELLEHITREALYYRDILMSLQRRERPNKTLCDELNFWNNIMGEHAQFIDGLLDPTERELKETAEAFNIRFETLVKECIETPDKLIIEKSTAATGEIMNYKKAATEGLLGCTIKSIILPLLGDHVLREANHYLRILKMLPR